MLPFIDEKLLILATKTVENELAVRLPIFNANGLLEYVTRECFTLLIFL